MINHKIKTTLILALVIAAIAAIGAAGYMYLSKAGANLSGAVLCASADEALCDHLYEDTVIAPTCSTQGYTKHVCTLCGDTYEDNYTDATGHSYVTYVVEPTCTASGYTLHQCRYCGSSYTDSETDALGHNYSDTEYEATCTERGYTYHVCLACGDSYKDSYTDALGHDYVADVTEATCLEGGYTVYTCSRCEDTYTADEVAALGHDYVITVKEATCTAYGYTKHVCSLCGDSYVTDYYSPSGHSYVATEKVASSEAEDGIGYTVYTCEICGNVKLDDFCDSGEDSYLHNIVYTYTDPTCTEYGYITIYCTDEGCDYYVEIINSVPTGHTAKAYYYAPTCEEDGCMKTICAVCGDEISVEYTEPATGHTYIGEVTEPTCLSGGYTTYTCSSCGDWYRAEETDPVGHTYKLVTSASRTNRTISASYTCASCGADGISSLMVVFTGTAGISYTMYFTDGTVSYASLPADTYTVCVYDTSGSADTLAGTFPITMSTVSETDLLLDGSATERTITSTITKNSATSSEAVHTHDLSVLMQNDEDAGFLYITAVCVNCGESLASEVQIRVTFADGTVSYLSADANGAVNYSYIPAGASIDVLSSDGSETLYSFTVADASSTGTGTATGTASGAAGGDTGSTTGSGTATDTDNGSGSTTDITDTFITDTEEESSSGSTGTAVACIIIAIIILALLAFVIYKILKNRKAAKAAQDAGQTKADKDTDSAEEEK